MEWLYIWGVGVIIQLQRLPIFTEYPYSEFWLLATKLGDPQTIFSFHAPVLFVFLDESATFVKFLMASCISEFLNGVFKWALLSDRPYWWIHTSGHGKDSEFLQLQQFPPTCETGPGSPSGHCMITAAAWIVLILSRKTKFSRVASILAYTISLVILALSRLYIGTHFPHQVIFGAIVGIIIGIICYQIKSASVTFSFCLKLILGLSISAIITYQSLLFFNYDPDWSIDLARRYCQNSDWIHLSTTPFGSLFRDTGALLGLGIVAQFFPRYLLVKYNGIGTKRRLLGIFFSLLLAQILTKLPVLSVSENLVWFYSCIFVEHAVLLVGYTVGIPALIGIQNQKIM